MFAKITAIAMIGKPKVVQGQKGGSSYMTLDTQFYFGTDSGEGMSACLLLYNYPRRVFAEEYTPYVVHANIIQSCPDACLDDFDEAGGNENKKYKLFGDIIWLKEIDIVDETTVQQMPWVEIGGLPSDLNPKELTFEVDVEQYVTAMSKTKKGRLYVKVSFPEGNRWKQKKPMPTTTSHYVYIAGFLERLHLGDDGFPKKFELGLHDIDFMGHAGASNVGVKEKSTAERLGVKQDVGDAPFNFKNVTKRKTTLKRERDDTDEVGQQAESSKGPETRRKK